MAHKTKIGGTAYEISSGKVLVGGTGYSIDKGRTKVGGTGYDISFGTPIGSLAVGSSVFFNINGNPYEFIVIQQGNPDSTKYDETCDGTWLLMKDIYVKSRWHSSYNEYAKSEIHSYLNNTFINLFDGDIQSAIKQVKIPYTNGKGNVGSLDTGSNGLTTKIFLLSFTEVGFSGSIAKKEGVVLDYFNGANDSDRVGYFNGSASYWWLRSPRTDGTARVWAVNTTGGSGYNSCSSSYGVRPVFILPYDFDITKYLA